MHMFCFVSFLPLPLGCGCARSPCRSQCLPSSCCPFPFCPMRCCSASHRATTCSGSTDLSYAVHVHVCVSCWKQTGLGFRSVVSRNCCAVNARQAGDQSDHYYVWTHCWVTRRYVHESYLPTTNNVLLTCRWQGKHVNVNRSLNMQALITIVFNNIVIKMHKRGFCIRSPQPLCKPWPDKWKSIFPRTEMKTYFQQDVSNALSSFFNPLKALETVFRTVSHHVLSKTNKK